MTQAVDGYTKALHALEKAIRASWCRETFHSDPRAQLAFDPTCPEKSQCLLTALVVQHYLGGDILSCEAQDGGKVIPHYLNILPNGTTVDLTRGQFSKDVKYVNYGVELNMFLLRNDKERAERYRLLLTLVQRNLDSYPLKV